MPPFRLYIFDAYYVITQENQSSQCLVIDRSIPPSDGKNDSPSRRLMISIENVSDIPLTQARFMAFHALVGIYWLHKGIYQDVVF